MVAAPYTTRSTAVRPGACLLRIVFPRYARETLQLMQFARVVPVEAEPVSFVDAHCAPPALIAAGLVEYSLRARERTEARPSRFERLTARHSICYAGD